MTATVREWVAKAEGDLAAALTLYRSRKHPNYEAVCFHAQQCVEKLMKALLMQAKIVPPRTHSLERLSDLLADSYGTWLWPDDELRFLTRAAVDLRYPGESADREEAKRALGIAQRVQKRLRELLGVPG